jgi:hypothetical protein
MLKVLLFLRDLNWLTISTLGTSVLSIISALSSDIPLTVAFAGASIALAVLALRD